MNKILLLLLIIIFSILQYRLWFSEGNVLRLITLHRTIQGQLNENSKLEERNARLAAEVQDLKSGNQAINERAREELGMVKPGETFYQFVKQPG